MRPIKRAGSSLTEAPPQSLFHAGERENAHSDMCNVLCSSGEFICVLHAHIWCTQSFTCVQRQDVVCLPLLLSICGLEIASREAHPSGQAGWSANSQNRPDFRSAYKLGSQERAAIPGCLARCSIFKTSSSHLLSKASLHPCSLQTLILHSLKHFSVVYVGQELVLKTRQAQIS